MFSKMYDLAFVIDGDTIDLEQDMGCGEVHRVILHRIHLRHLAEQAGLLTAGAHGDPDQVIDRLSRQLRLLAHRIDTLDTMMLGINAKGHECVDEEVAYSGASWDLAREFVADLPTTNSPESGTGTGSGTVGNTPENGAVATGNPPKSGVIPQANPPKSGVIARTVDAATSDPQARQIVLPAPNGTASTKAERQKRWRDRCTLLANELLALGVTPPKGASLEMLERLHGDATRLRETPDVDAGLSHPSTHETQRSGAP